MKVGIHSLGYVANSTEEALDTYKENLSKGKSSSTNEIKLNIVGQGSVGKTSVLRRILENNFSDKEAKTDGISIARWLINSSKPNGKKIRINAWDFGGQEIMHATHQFFLSKRSLYLLVLVYILFLF